MKYIFVPSGDVTEAMTAHAVARSININEKHITHDAVDKVMFETEDVVPAIFSSYTAYTAAQMEAIIDAGEAIEDETDD